MPPTLRRRKIAIQSSPSTPKGPPMSTAVRPGRRSAADDRGSAATQPADVFVVFGITGDLARVMTFQALYRLERRGLLDCPILGVAGDDWTIDQLREHARKCIADTG